MEDSIARKLAVPKKLSAWEREKQAAEAKKQRQEAENAAALRDFQRSLGVDDEDDFPPASGRDRDRRSSNGARAPDRSLPVVRHAPSFPRGPSKPRSGPGSLGPVEGYEQPPSLKRKRALDEAREQSRRYEDDELSRASRGTPSQERSRNANPDPGYDLPKPTVYLQAFPPSATLEELKALLAPHLKVHSIRFVDRQRQEPGKRPLTAIATLTLDTNLTHIENAIKVLNNKYMSCGYRLSMSRFDESSFNVHTTNGRKIDAPFGASVVESPAHSFSMRNAPPPSEHHAGRRGYNDRRGYGSRRQDLEVRINLPLDICTAQAVHTVADRLLSEPDVDRALELEALFMRLPEVQSDEKFSFLYDSTSPAGVYYRYCLWSRDVLDEERKKGQNSERIHDDIDTIWNISAQEATFPNLTQLSQVVTDLDYVSSEDESDNEDVRPRQPDRPEPETLLADNERNFLLPLQHARLTHLLARLPTVNTRLRRGDVARVTNFAINHAGKGAEQIVDKILLNVDMPFATTEAAKYEAKDDESRSASDNNSDYADDQPRNPAATVDGSGAPTTSDDTRQYDPSGAKLVALYVISDILSASATAGARNAWKYRQLFEAGFKRQKTFDKLGSIDRELGWGRMKMDHWKRKVAAIFDIWESWSVFSSEAMQTFRRTFNQEPEPEQPQLDQPAIADAESRKPKWMTKVKVIDKDNVKPVQHEQPEGDSRDKTVESEDVISKENAMDEHLPSSELASTTKEDTKTSSHAADSDQPSSSTNATDRVQESSELPAPAPLVPKSAPTSTPAPKRRMRAEDMFADSDEEGRI